MKLLKKVLGSLLVVAILFVPLFFNMEAKAATEVLTVGSSGSQVTELQNDLKSLGYFSNSSITGYYGTVTRYSVMKFQAAYSLSADGIVGPTTLSKIKSVLGSQSTSAYTIKAGDTLWTISQKYGTTIERLKVLNGISADTVYPGQTIKVPVQTSTTSTLSAATVTQAQNEDMYWLSRIIEAEASGEPYQGKVAVGNVILNRRSSPDFPSTIKGVIFDSFRGIAQFSPVADGRIYNTPSQDSIRAASEALNGARPVGTCTYFFNPDKSAAIWIVNNKTYVMRIGNHVFYD